ncbi:MAG TPA: preprotein translocase subunit SecE [Caulobacteraceae bacterium]|jgi:preprotein translocase subunit SecE
MAKDQGAVPTNLRPRGPARSAPPAVDEGGKGFNVVDALRSAPKFFAEVRAEMRKVTWTTWKETWITSVMVGIMVVLAALFFFGVDAAFSFAINQILKLGNLGA